MADKTLNEIRNTFLKYFEKNDHKIVESSNFSGIPAEVQTLDPSAGGKYYVAPLFDLLPLDC